MPGLNPMPTQEREWTLMVYLAGDNNLETYGERDLKEMKVVGSTDQVAIVAQFDRQSSGDTRRYYLRPATPLEDDCVGPDLGETNSGDPRELARFMTWAMDTYPAKRYGLVLWNHGTGWREDDIYSVAVRSELHKIKAPGVLGPLVDRIARREGYPILFESSISSILARGLGYDDTSMDFLDNAEMERALTTALFMTGVDKLDLLGFDACLMNMVEVAYQVRSQARVLVGSQETEPGAGWPYDTIVAELVARPEMDGAALAGKIVDCFVESYGDSESVTQSAIDLEQVPLLAQALSNVAEYVIKHKEACYLIMGRAIRVAQSFADPDYKDIHDLCRAIVERSAEVPELAQRAQAVLDLLHPQGEGRLVLHEAHHGPRMAHVYGLSIYIPARGLSPFYGRLAFSSETLWDDMLNELIRA